MWMMKGFLYMIKSIFLKFIRNDVFIPVIPDGDDTNADNSNTDTEQFIDGFNKILSDYRWIVVGVYVISVMTIIVMLMYYFMVLGANSNNPMERSRTFPRIFAALLGLSILGNIFLFILLLWNFLR